MHPRDFEGRGGRIRRLKGVARANRQRRESESTCRPPHVPSLFLIRHSLQAHFCRFWACIVWFRAAARVFGFGLGCLVAVLDGFALRFWGGEPRFRLWSGSRCASFSSGSGVASVRIGLRLGAWSGTMWGCCSHTRHDSSFFSDSASLEMSPSAVTRRRACFVLRLLGVSV